VKNRYLNLYVLLLIVCLGITGCQSQGKKKEVRIPEILQNHQDFAFFTKLADTIQIIPLFNGKDLTNWYTYTDSLGVNNPLEDAFVVEDSVLHFNGKFNGYIATNNSYKNYYLKVVFHWGDKPQHRENGKGNSGILYHFPIDVSDKLWPNSLQCQIKEETCGDYICIDGSNAESSSNETIEGTQKRIVRTENFENPGKEWNVIEIICTDDKSEHYVNGRLVNQAHNLSNTEGKIALQYEGWEIYYKTIELILLK
jgi:hypothetical protein